MTTLTTPNTTEVRQEFILPIAQVLHLQRLAADRHISENDLVARALDMFLGMADLFQEDNERRGWYRLAEPTLLRVWDNEGDAVYDNWRESMAYQKGDVVLLPVPFTNFQSSRIRPAVVLSSSEYHATEPDLILGAITTKLASATASVDYVLHDWRAANLYYPSAFKPVIFTVEPSLILYKVGSLSKGDLSEIERRL